MGRAEVEGYLAGRGLLRRTYVQSMFGAGDKRQGCEGRKNHFFHIHTLHYNVSSLPKPVKPGLGL